MKILNYILLYSMIVAIPAIYCGDNGLKQTLSAAQKTHEQNEKKREAQLKQDDMSRTSESLQEKWRLEEKLQRYLHESKRISDEKEKVDSDLRHIRSELKKHEYGYGDWKDQLFKCCCPCLHYALDQIGKGAAHGSCCC